MHEQTNLMKDIHIKLDATSYLCISVPLSCCGSLFSLSLFLGFRARILRFEFL